jgi:hypothetical protein
MLQADSLFTWIGNDEFCGALPQPWHWLRLPLWVLGFAWIVALLRKSA